MLQVGMGCGAALACLQDGIHSDQDGAVLCTAARQLVPGNRHEGVRMQSVRSAFVLQRC